MIEKEGGRLREYVELADGAIGCSEYVTSRIEQRVPALRGRCHTVYNGFDPDRFAPDPEVRRSPNVLAFAGRVTPEKGAHVLVDAFRSLAEERLDLELVVAGPPWITDPVLLAGTDPEHHREIRTLVPAQRFQLLRRILTRVGLPGMRPNPSQEYRAELVRRAGHAGARLRLVGTLLGEDLVRLYRSCTVFVQPALWEEAFGMPIVEAMACGAPVVVSQRGGMPELLNPGVTGLVVPSGDPRALAEALAQLLDDPAARAQMGASGITAARERFEWSRSAATLAKILSAG